MGVHLRGRHIRVAKQLLHGPDVIAGLNEVSCKTVPEGVARCSLGEFRRQHRLLHRTLYGLAVQMMAADNAATRVGRLVIGREDLVPAPLRPSGRILPLQCIGQHHAVATRQPVLFIQRFRIGQLVAQRLNQ